VKAVVSAVVGLTQAGPGVPTRHAAAAVCVGLRGHVLAPSRTRCVGGRSVRSDKHAKNTRKHPKNTLQWRTVCAHCPHTSTEGRFIACVLRGPKSAGATWGNRRLLGGMLDRSVPSRHPCLGRAVVSMTYPFREALFEDSSSHRLERVTRHAPVHQPRDHGLVERSCDAEVSDMEALVVAADEPDHRVEQRSRGVDQAVSTTGRARGSRHLRRPSEHGPPTAPGKPTTLNRTGPLASCTERQRPTCVLPSRAGAQVNARI
jgi:hypothetical protein